MVYLPTWNGCSICISIYSWYTLPWDYIEYEHVWTHPIMDILSSPRRFTPIFTALFSVMGWDSAKWKGGQLLAWRPIIPFVSFRLAFFKQNTISTHSNSSSQGGFVESHVMWRFFFFGCLVLVTVFFSPSLLGGFDDKDLLYKAEVWGPTFAFKPTRAFRVTANQTGIVQQGVKQG